MPRFDTPGAISVSLDLVVGDAQFIAGDAAHTVVEVQPTDASKSIDVEAAEQTDIEFRNGRLLIKAPRQRGYLGYGRKKGASVDVTVTLPAGSRLEATAAVGGFHCEGRFGECRLQTGLGAIRVDRADSVHLDTSGGDVAVDRVAGPADVTSGGGTVRVRRIDGTAVIKNWAGTVTVGDVTGDVRADTTAGDIVIDRAHASVEASTTLGQVHLREVAGGTVTLKSGGGAVDVGIRAGTSAWIDAHSAHGSVHNLLEPSDKPEPSDRTVKVRAQTEFGDIVIRRSPLLSDTVLSETVLSDTE
ncbi:DUF4097 family beta strand repeat-containing protein [Streptomyces sp. P1-3]|uniref:DUF4097 family beta strand repeat-containing protein n=1 Tax=Streptomyces sp. P1-3 TaxID=3421658 RepID=UPI003D36B7A7